MKPIKLKLIGIEKSNNIFYHFTSCGVSIKRPYAYPFAALSDDLMLSKILGTKFCLFVNEIVVIGMTFASSIYFYFQLSEFKIIELLAHTILAGFLWLFALTSLLTAACTYFWGAKVKARVAMVEDHRGSGDDLLSNVTLIDSEGIHISIGDIVSGRFKPDDEVTLYRMKNKDFQYGFIGRKDFLVKLFILVIFQSLTHINL